jgi:ferredoxin
MPIILKIHTQEIELENHHDSTVIDLARNQGLFLKSSCGGKGKCGSCLVHLLQGQFLIEDKEIVGKSYLYNRQTVSLVVGVPRDQFDLLTSNFGK